VLKTCPTCRKPSEFVLPSFKFAKGEEKEELLKTYKNELASIPCKYFHRTGRNHRQCPFGDDCFYQHNDSKGNRIPCIPRRQRLPNEMDVLAQMLFNLHSHGYFDHIHHDFDESDQSDDSDDW
jgi:hypothetical protein